MGTRDPAGRQVGRGLCDAAELKPGGGHVMPMGLKRPLKHVEHIPLALKFAHAPPLRVQVEVATIGATRPDAGGRADTMKDVP